MKTDRILGIIIYLMNHDNVSASYLAERFHVSVRTIQRDMRFKENLPILRNIGLRLCSVTIVRLAGSFIAVIAKMIVQFCFSKTNVYYIEAFRRHTTKIPRIHCKNNVRRGFYREGLYRGACSRNRRLYHRNKSNGTADSKEIRDQ